MLCRVYFCCCSWPALPLVARWQIHNSLRGGALIAHFPTGMAFSSDPPTGGWCQHYWDNYRIEDCEEQVNRIDTEDEVIWFVLAAWDEEKEWCGTEFGFGEYDSTAFVITGFSPCWPADGLEIPTAAWPGPEEGTAIVVTSDPWEGNFVPVYWFSGYAYEEGLIPLAKDPATGFAGTANCANPPGTWAADSLGGMGLFQDGVYACPAGFLAGGPGLGPQGGGGIEPESGGESLEPEEPTVWAVCPQGGTFQSIQAAVDASIVAHGDTLELCCDHPFTGELNRNIEFDGKRLVIRSECDDPTRCTIDCDGSSAGQDDPRRAFAFGEGDTALVRSVAIFDGVAGDPHGS